MHANVTLRRIRGACAFYFLACLLCMPSVSALCWCQLILVAQGSCLYAPHPQPPYGAGEVLPALKPLCLPGF